MAFLEFLRLIIISIATLSVSSSYSQPLAPHQGFDGFVARLIHRSSPESPFFNPNLTYDDVIIEGVHSTYSKDLGASPQAPISYDYTMTYGIGTPPVMTYATPHTGSDLIWLQCKPCLHCFDQDLTPVFDPRNSSSFTQLACVTQRCQSVPWTVCGTEDVSCICEIRYEDRRLPRSVGIISTETFSFFSSSNSTGTNAAIISFPNITFGCGELNEDPWGTLIPGIIGLLNATNSLVGQLNLKSFSYCVNKDNISSDYNGWIRFGSATILTGESTPLVPNYSGSYYLNLEQIKVDDTYLDVANFFKSIYFLESRFMIDSGTSITTLYTDAYSMMINEIKSYYSSQGEKQQPYGVGAWEFCYDQVDIEYAPAIYLVFTNLEFELSFANTWIRVMKEDMTEAQCLAIMRTEAHVAVLGYYQLRGVNVGYDLLSNKLWLQYQNDCPV